jgi:hypothetical protein
LKRIGKIHDDWEFNPFVKKVLAERRESFDIHFLPQFHWSMPLKAIDFDYIGRFENIKKDWSTIASFIGTKPDLPHANKGSSKNFRDYYDLETKDIVFNLYKDDFLEFGYDQNF